MRRFLIATSVIASLALTTPASAALVLIQDPSLAQSHTIQIFSDGVQSGDKEVFGHLEEKGVNGAGFRFTTPASNIAASGGQGHISVTGPFHELLVAPTNSSIVLTELKFNFDVQCCVARKPDFFADVFADDILVGTVQLRNSSNPYLLVGNAGETFHSVRFVGWEDAQRTISASFRDISQFETVATQGASAAIPEPATWALMILGFGLASAMLRRQRRPAGSILNRRAFTSARQRR